MRLTKFILSTGILIALIFALNRPLPMGDASTPPLGKFLSPYSGFWQNAEQSDALPLQEKINTDYLKSAVSVTYDDRMIPHIFAANETDAAYVQGYVTAQHRLWQLEFQTHAAAGRVSEIVGKRALNFDKIQRRRGMVNGAEKTFKQWKKSSYFELLEAYSQGINDYINQLDPTDYPLEYKILDYAPEPWTPFKSALLLKYMGNTLARHDGDIERTNALEYFGEDLFEFLYPDDFPEQDPIIPSGTKWDFEPVPLKAEKPTTPESDDELISHQLMERIYPGIGSNNWAVAASKTKNGNPILCSDPHLNMTLPSIWYEVQVHVPNANAYGVSLPGIPGVIIGFNEHIAWGQTNVGRDVMDWYQIKWKDDSRMEYELDGGYKKVNLKIEEIKVKGGETIYDTVRYTHHGPIVYEDPKQPKHDMALRWIVHYGGNGDDLGVFSKLNNAKNYDDYVDAIMDYDVPAQNYVFASKEGDIALWTQGIYPLKAKGQGRFILDGSKSSNDWHGWIPKAHNPHVKNPERGFVASANQHSTDSTYPYYYRGGFGDYRGRILNQQLGKMDNITVEDMMKLQFSSQSLKPEEALPLMLSKIKTGNLSGEEKAALEIVRVWDYVYAMDSKAPPIFENWFDEMYELLWDEVYTKNKEKTPITYPEEWRTIALMRDNPDHKLFDIANTPKIETIEDVVTKGFKKAFEKVAEWETKNGQDATWSDYKATRVGHLADIPGLSQENIAVGGNGTALNAVGKQHGPSWRMVVELAPEGVKAYGVYPGGQSGNPGSKYYNDFVDNWSTGTHFPLLFMQSADEESDRIVFKQSFGN